MLLSVVLRQTGAGRKGREADQTASCSGICHLSDEALVLPQRGGQSGHDEPVSTTQQYRGSALKPLDQNQGLEPPPDREAGWRMPGERSGEGLDDLSNYVERDNRRGGEPFNKQDAQERLAT